MFTEKNEETLIEGLGTLVIDELGSVRWNNLIFFEAF